MKKVNEQQLGVFTQSSVKDCVHAFTCKIYKFAHHMNSCLFVGKMGEGHFCIMKKGMSGDYTYLPINLTSRS